MHLGAVQIVARARPDRSLASHLLTDEQNESVHTTKKIAGPPDGSFFHIPIGPYGPAVCEKLHQVNER